MNFCIQVVQFVNSYSILFIYLLLLLTFIYSAYQIHTEKTLLDRAWGLLVVICFHLLVVLVFWVRVHFDPTKVGSLIGGFIFCWFTVLQIKKYCQIENLFNKYGNWEIKKVVQELEKSLECHEDE